MEAQICSNGDVMSVNIAVMAVIFYHLRLSDQVEILFGTIYSNGDTATSNTAAMYGHLEN